MPISPLKKPASPAGRNAKPGAAESLGERAPLDTVELQAALGFRLREAWTAMERHFLQRFQQEQVTPALYAILVLVAANPDCLASEICAVTSISSANIIPYLDDLVERGLIQREVGVRDRRVKHLRLTEAGAERLESWRQLEKRVVQHFQKKLGAANLPKLIEWLSIIARNE